MQDLTGQPPTDLDVFEATQVLKRFIVQGILGLPPQLAVQMPNIIRCLQDYEKLRSEKPAPEATRWPRQHVWGRP